MGRIHIWGPESRATIAGRDIVTTAYYLELAGGDDEDDVLDFFAERLQPA